MPEIAHLTTGELDWYGNQLIRRLKALDTAAPIRAHVNKSWLTSAPSKIRARTSQHATHITEIHVTDWRLGDQLPPLAAK